MPRGKYTANLFLICSTDVYLIQYLDKYEFAIIFSHRSSFCAFTGITYFQENKRNANYVRNDLFQIVNLAIV